MNKIDHFESLPLNLRLTHAYVGTHKQLDKHTEIGSYQQIQSIQHRVTEEDENDPCVPITHSRFILVDSDTPHVHRVRQALVDTFTAIGCTHDFDCCGCRNYSVTKAEPITGNLWCVEVRSSSNY